MEDKSVLLWEKGGKFGWCGLAGRELEPQIGDPCKAHVWCFEEGHPQRGVETMDANSVAKGCE